MLFKVFKNHQHHSTQQNKIKLKTIKNNPPTKTTKINNANTKKTFENH